MCCKAEFIYSHVLIPGAKKRVGGAALNEFLHNRLNNMQAAKIKNSMGKTSFHINCKLLTVYMYPAEAVHCPYDMYYFFTPDLYRKKSSWHA